MVCQYDDPRSQNTINDQRWHELDALKGFAMLLGIGLHAALSFFPTFWPVQDRHMSSEDFFGGFVAAVHGFRMPLFFLLSGFFTTMLWRRRGVSSMLWHRVQRIGIPLAIGIITIIPAMDWVSDRVSESPEYTNNPEIALEAGRQGDIWTPIFMNSPGGVELAVLAGADVNTRGDDAWTPLHLAAAMSQPKTVEILLIAGADPEALTVKGETPLVLSVWKADTSSADLLVAYGAKDFRIADSTWQEISWFGDGIEKENKDRDLGLKSWIDQFHHLWFLWFLCWLVIGFALAASIAARSKHILNNSINQYFLWLLIPLSYPLQLSMGDSGNYPTFGPDTSTGLLPAKNVLIYYALFFTFGAISYSISTPNNKPLMTQIGRRWKILLPITILILLPFGLHLTYEDGNWWAACIFQVAYTWGMSFGLVGLFRRLFSIEKRGVRYLSDASYWMYLTHLPLVIIFQWLVKSWNIPAILKFLLICITISGLLLSTYQVFVRYTPIGTMLNGQRKRLKLTYP